MKISAILAVGKDNEIGLNGSLPWQSKADLQYFKSLTTGHHVLMGLNTYKSIGKPLKNRTNIVVSFDYKKIEGCITFSNIEEGIEYAKNNGEVELFIIGGASVYKYCYEHNLIDRVYLTHMLY